MSLKNKRILITAGPTWVAIDKVRVISNTASGETGILLARMLESSGAKVTLLLGGGNAAAAGRRSRVVGFRFFEELRGLLAKELRRSRYDAVIHSAAVSDFRPARKQRGKIPSGRKISLTLVPTPKLIGLIRAAAPSALLAGFKYLPGAGRAELLKAGNDSCRRWGAELVVANTVKDKSYRAYVITPDSSVAEAGSKGRLAEILVKYLKENL